MVPRLYLIGPRRLFPTEAAWLDGIERVANAVGACAATAGLADVEVALQVRIESDADAERLAARARDRARRAWPQLPLFLNAPCAGAGFDGVHWPERRIPRAAAGSEPGPARSTTPRGASVHSEAALRRAEAAGADFAVFGPVWSPTWKAATPQSLGALGALVATARIPILAIGGISPRRVGECLQAGAAGVAVASGVFSAADATSALLAYGSALGSTRHVSPD